MTSLADIIKQNDFLSLTSNNRILCSYTKHEMPARLDCVLNHLNSKGLKKAKEWYSYDYSGILQSLSISFLFSLTINTT